MAELITISNVLNEIQAAYPNWRADADTVKVWTVYVSDLDDDLLIASVRKFISSSPHAFPPTIPEIRTMATQLMMEISSIPTPYEAWGMVQDEIRRVGSYGQPAFKNDIVAQVVRRFGWRSLCLSETEMVDRAHFTKAYEETLKNEIGRATRLPQINEYIQIETQSQMKMLTDKMSKGRNQ
jgi:hypothetical protein